MNWQIVSFIGLPVLRSFAGWLNGSLQDNKIEKFELNLLLATMLRVTIISTLIYFGCDKFGVNIDLLGASIAGYLTDIILRTIEKMGKK